MANQAMNKALYALGKFSFLILSLTICSCAYDNLEEQIDCTQSSLSISLAGSVGASSCAASDGVINVAANGGVGPYTFSLGSSSNASGQFQGLAAGTYLVKAIDANSCERTLEIDLDAIGSNLGLTVNTTADTQCPGDNGSIVAIAQGGAAPFEFRINSEAFGSANTFSNLSAGDYTVEIKDSQGCIFKSEVTIARVSSGVSFETQIKPIISTKCAISGCHNGDNGASRNWTVFQNVKSNAVNIKTRTGNRSMPLTGSLTQEQIDLIACWVDDGAPNN